MACKKYMRRFAALPWGRNWVAWRGPSFVSEVSGSSPLSSTWSEVRFEQIEQQVQQESTATAARRAAVRVFDRICSPGWGCWQDTGFQALNRRWSTCHLGSFLRTGPVTLAGWPPPGPLQGPFLPTLLPRLQVVWPRWASRPARFHSRESRQLAYGVSKLGY